MRLLGVTLSSTSRKEILATVRKFLAEPKYHRIVTINPEFLVLANNDTTFKKTLLAADLSVADGFGIVLAGLLYGEKVTRFPGADLLDDVLAFAEKNGLTVFLALRKDGLSSYEEIYMMLLKKYPDLKVTGQTFALRRNFSLSSLSHRASNIVFCNFGAPEQEFFLESLRSNPGVVRLAMGIGGSFDYLTGKQTRAPKWLRALGLEWLWRLVLQPRRFRRIWTAVVIFPFLLLLHWQKSEKRL